MFSVQYHPEASPGPRDSHYLFSRFVELMRQEARVTNAARRDERVRDARSMAKITTETAARRTDRRRVRRRDDAASSTCAAGELYPKDARAAASSGLWNQVFVYALSFYVLGLRWAAWCDWLRATRTSASIRQMGDAPLAARHVVPFTTMLVGRYIQLAPQLAYAANTILFALVAIRHDHARGGRRERDRCLTTARAHRADRSLGAHDRGELFVPNCAMLVYLLT